jgi:EpsG family
VYLLLIPYLAMAGLMLAGAGARGWRLCNPDVDRLISLLFILATATIAGSLDLGTDAPGYRVYYVQLSSYTDHYAWWEPGFEWAASLFSRIGAPYGLFVFACVLCSHLLKLQVIQKLCINSVLVFFVLYCVNLGEMAFVRQYLAASIIFLAFYLLASSRVIWALMAIIAAGLVHKTALIAGIIIVLMHFRRSLIKGLSLLTIATLGILAVVPSQIMAALTGRVLSQFADYTAEGFVQGLESENISLARNVSKFFLYIVIAGWMVALPAESRREQIQRSAGYLVLVLSILGVTLTAGISPVFSRLSLYIFPFLALAVRAERFEPDYRKFFGQYMVVGLLMANLAISLYPMLEYLQGAE